MIGTIHYNQTVPLLIKYNSTWTIKFCIEGGGIIQVSSVLPSICGDNCPSKKMIKVKENIKWNVVVLIISL
jgi:hypothetical protein